VQLWRSSDHACGNTFPLPVIDRATPEARYPIDYRALDYLNALFFGWNPGDRVAWDDNMFGHISMRMIINKLAC
jgi:hypothetical protein